MNPTPRHAVFALVALCGLLVLPGGLISCSSPEGGGGPGEGWTEDIDAALKRAKETDRPVLLNFTGSDWCGWCVRLHKEVFSTDAFKSYADENLVLVTLDFPRRREQSAEIAKRNRALQRKYGIRGFPTIVVLDPSGKKLGTTGYVRGGPPAFLAQIKRITGR